MSNDSIITRGTYKGYPAPVPQTGQSNCYDADSNQIDGHGTGQDGAYQKGVVWPNPRFTDNHDGTVTDNLTGLIWLKKANAGGQKLWDDALTFANQLKDGDYGLSDSSQAGDWRLPNRLELESLLNHQYIKPTLSNTAGTGKWTQADPFTNVESGRYWTSSTSAHDTKRAWNVHFDNASSYQGNFKSYSGNWVWPVRGTYKGSCPAPVPQTGETNCYDADGNQIDCHGTGQDGAYQKGVKLPTPRFTDNHDGTVTDNLTGLIWLKNANANNGPMNWSDALTLANRLKDGDCGLSDGSQAGDWRLPNRFELKSLINFDYFNPALSNTAGTGKWTQADPFTNIQSDIYWSSSTCLNGRSIAWFVHLCYGNVHNTGKASYHYVWLVRGGQ